MPYIKQTDRVDTKLDHPGNLNYLISKLCVDYVEKNGLNYRTINDIIGVLDCAKQEFYIRVARPYEDLKIQENGDIGYDDFTALKEVAKSVRPEKGQAK